MKNTVFEGAATAIITPLNENGIDFAKFAELIYDEHKTYQEPGTYVNEGKNWNDTFIDVWAGRTTLDAAVADYSKRESAALKTAVEKGTYNIDVAKKVEAEKLADWKAGNLCNDDRLDVFDLCLMKRELLKNN